MAIMNNFLVSFSSVQTCNTNVFADWDKFEFVQNEISYVLQINYSLHRKYGIVALANFGMLTYP